MSTSDPDGAFVLPEPMLDLTTFVVFQVMREARRLAANLSDLAGDDLRVPHVTVLASLAEFGPAAQKDISCRLRIDPSDLVALLDDLERAGLATRSRDQRDRRRYTVAITPEGETRLRTRLSALRELDENLFAPLDQRERAELHSMMLRLCAHQDPRRIPRPMLEGSGSPTSN